MLILLPQGRAGSSSVGLAGRAGPCPQNLILAHVFCPRYNSEGLRVGKRPFPPRVGLAKPRFAAGGVDRVFLRRLLQPAAVPTKALEPKPPRSHRKSGRAALLSTALRFQLRGGCPGAPGQLFGRRKPGSGFARPKNRARKALQVCRWCRPELPSGFSGMSRCPAAVFPGVFYRVHRSRALQAVDTQT